MALAGDRPATDDGPAAGYELLDAGDGRRLERFGPRIVDRPAPTATAERRNPDAWQAADLRFERGTGWLGPGARGPWSVAIAGLTLELRPTEAGQVGVFPEQAETWAFLREHLAPGAEVLNLFAYTGAATLVAAAAGARVVHIDASRPSVRWARRNAELSGLADRPVRWIVDDVEAFLQREIRRGHRYDGILLDPPSYGHGSGGRAWRLDDRLLQLLDLVAAVAGDAAWIALTAHTPGRWPRDLRAALMAAAGPGKASSGRLLLHASTEVSLPLGAWARMIRAG